MKFLCTEKLSSHRFKTPEGYLICTDAILARTGKQSYLRKEVFGDQCDNGEVEIEVDRPYNEVFSKETLASFENKPVTVEHPDENVNCENWKEYQVGFVRDIKQGKSFTGEDIMIGTLVIQDADTINEIEKGEHTEISCGYDCDVDDTENPYQRNIRGNHVALCQQGRAGIARIIDSINDSTEEQWQNSLWDYGISYNFISGGYGMKFKSASDYNKAKALAEKLHYKGGHWYDQDLEYYSYGSSRISNDDIINDSLQVWQVHQGYAIVAKKYWNQYGNKAYVDRVEQSIDSARYVRSSLERNDNMSFVIIDCNDRNYKVKDENMKDIKTTNQSGIDKIIYTMQSDVDKNLYFYIGKNFSMKEGMFGYTKYVMDDMTPDQLKNELIRNGWHQTASGPAKIIDVLNEKENNSTDMKDLKKDILNNDEGAKVYQCKSGYVIVLKRYYDRYGKYAYIERRADDLDKARNARQSLERNDELEYVIIDCNNGKYNVVDSCNEYKIKDEWIKTPRGEIKLSEKTEEQLKKEGYGYHFSFEKDGKKYKILNNGRSALAVVDSCNEYKIKYKDSKGNCHIHIVNADSMISAVKKVKKDLK